MPPCNSRRHQQAYMRMMRVLRGAKLSLKTKLVTSWTLFWRPTKRRGFRSSLNCLTIARSTWRILLNLARWGHTQIWTTRTRTRTARAQQRTLWVQISSLSQLQSIRVTSMYRCLLTLWPPQPSKNSLIYQEASWLRSSTLLRIEKGTKRCSDIPMPVVYRESHQIDSQWDRLPSCRKWLKSRDYNTSMC